MGNRKFFNGLFQRNSIRLRERRLNHFYVKRLGFYLIFVEISWFFLSTFGSNADAAKSDRNNSWPTCTSIHPSSHIHLSIIHRAEGEVQRANLNDMTLAENSSIIMRCLQPGPNIFRK